MVLIAHCDHFDCGYNLVVLCAMRAGLEKSNGRNTHHLTMDGKDLIDGVLWNMAMISPGRFQYA